MKWIYLACISLLLACSNNGGRVVPANKGDTFDDQSKPKGQMTNSVSNQSALNPIVYANGRFNDVTVEKLGKNKYRLRGRDKSLRQGSGVVEDGHIELPQGFEDTGAGAPEWVILISL